MPASPVRTRFYSGWRYAQRHRRLPPPGALLIFAAVVPVAVACFEIYAHLDQAWGLFVSLALLLLSVAYYYLRVGRGEWQNRFHDYRALAEAMRVQVFWGLAATPVAASDNYLRQQSGELGWIQFALRGPALWAAALAFSLVAPNRPMVTAGWIEDQINFFGKDRDSGKTGDNRRIARHSILLFQIFLFAEALITSALALMELTRPPADPTSYEALLRHWLVELAATLPAVEAFFAISAEKRAYEPHYRSYRLMGAIFGPAMREAKNIPANKDAEFQELMRDLGREALAENAEWLLDHRHRPIKHQ